MSNTTLSLVLQTLGIRPTEDILTTINVYKNTKKRRARLREQERLDKVEWYIVHASLIGHYPQKFYTAKTMSSNPKWHTKDNVVEELKRLGCKWCEPKIIKKKKIFSPPKKKKKKKKKKS